MKITEERTLDLAEPVPVPPVYAKQGDRDSRCIRLFLTAHGVPYTVPQGGKVMLRVVKPDGHMVQHPAILQPDGAVEVTLSQQALAVSGDVVADLQLWGPGEVLLATTNFVIHVDEALTGSLGQSVSENLFLEEQVAQAMHAADRAERIAQQMPRTIQQELDLAKASGKFNGPKGDPPPLDRTLTRAGYAADAQAVGQRLGLVETDGAGAHNALYGGRNLGSFVSAEQYRSIRDGSFRNLYIGDYWTIRGMVYRIAGFDGFFRRGDLPCTQHHVVIVPDQALKQGQMHRTASGDYETGAQNTTEGGYVGSDLYRHCIPEVKQKIEQDFPNHVLSHRMYLVNAVANGCAAAGIWVDSTVELLSDYMVFGSGVLSPTSDGSQVPAHYRLDAMQLPLFGYRPDLVSTGQYYWLRDVISSSYFSLVDPYGRISCDGATLVAGIRPFFCLKGDEK